MHSPLEPSMGFNKLQYTIDSSGYRQTAFRAYLPQEFVDTHPNLHICTKTLACKLEFSDKSIGTLRAEAVELRAIDGTQRRVIKAGHEIILACGALHTPKLLLLSGVGPRDQLQRMGVSVLKHSPGVGEHLQDHMLCQTIYNIPLSGSLWEMTKRPTALLREVYNYVRYGTGWFLSTLAEMEVFGMSPLIGSDGKPSTLSEAQLDPFNPQNLPDFGVLLIAIGDISVPGVDKSKGIISLTAGLLLVQSRGTLRLRSADPMVDPDCDLQYLTSPADYAALRAALRVSAAIAQEMRANGYQMDDVLVPDTSSDAALDDFIRKTADTMYHYSSSCRMAPEDDERPGVVDDELRVYGIDNVRIADASIFPEVPATHPQALIYAVAEKCADLVLQNASA